MPAQLQLPPPASTLSVAWRFAAPTALPTPTHGTTDASARRHSALARRARLTGRLAKLAATGQLAPLARQINTLGGCAHPIRLTGHRTRLDSATGEILDHLNSGQLPAGELLVRCGNRPQGDATSYPHLCCKQTTTVLDHLTDPKRASRTPIESSRGGRQ